jgi:hypothetical protein
VAGTKGREVEAGTCGPSLALVSVYLYFWRQSLYVGVVELVATSAVVVTTVDTLKEVSRSACVEGWSPSWEVLEPDALNPMEIRPDVEDRSSTMLEVGVSGGRGRSVRDEVGVGLENLASEVEVPELWLDNLETEVAMLVLEFRLELLLV